MSEFWFARRFPVGNRRNSIAPVSREGRLVVAGFIFGMLLGALVFMAMAAAGELILGAATFAVIAGLAGGGFIIVAQKRADQKHTVDDYTDGVLRPRPTEAKGGTDGRSRARHG